MKKRIKDRIAELRIMQIQASDNYEFCEQMEYAIKELSKLLLPATENLI